MTRSMMSEWVQDQPVRDPSRKGMKAMRQRGRLTNLEPDDWQVKPLANKRILIVEDDFLIAYELARCVEEMGGVVLGPAGSTRLARMRLKNEPCDGALLDVNLGQETSLDLARDLQAQMVPVLFVTAYADHHGLFDNGLALTPRIGKPVSHAALKRRAAELFAGPRFSA